MTHLPRTFALLSAVCLVAPGAAHAEDALVSPEAARNVESISRDATQKVKTGMDKAPKIPEAKSQLEKPAVEAVAPKMKKQLQSPQSPIKK